MSWAEWIATAVVAFIGGWGCGLWMAARKIARRGVVVHTGDLQQHTRAAFEREMRRFQNEARRWPGRRREGERL